MLGTATCERPDSESGATDRGRSTGVTTRAIQWMYFFLQAEDGIRDLTVTGVQTCALPISRVEVGDLSAPMTSIGPYINPLRVGLLTLPIEQEGCVPGPTGSPLCGSVFNYDSNTVFGFSGQFNNVQSLPFPATFTGPGLLIGQNISIHSTGQSTQGSELVTTATLS